MTAMDKWVTWSGTMANGHYRPANRPFTLRRLARTVSTGRCRLGGIPPSSQPTAMCRSAYPCAWDEWGACSSARDRSACPTALAADWNPTDNQSVAIQPDQNVLQLGTVYTVPVRGGTFKSEGAIIAMDANGLPTSIEVSEKVAAASLAASTAASAATQIVNIPTQVAAAQLARTQAETAQINAQNALITARATASTAAPTAAAQAQTTLLGAQASLATAKANAQTVGPIGVMAAQTAEINAQNNLAAAQATGATAAQVDTLAAHTALLNAEAAQINAQVALTKAQALVP